MIALIAELAARTSDVLAVEKFCPGNSLRSFRAAAYIYIGRRHWNSEWKHSRDLAFLIYLFNLARDTLYVDSCCSVSCEYTYECITSLYYTMQFLATRKNVFKYFQSSAKTATCNWTRVDVQLTINLIKQTSISDSRSSVISEFMYYILRLNYNTSLNYLYTYNIFYLHSFFSLNFLEISYMHCLKVKFKENSLRSNYIFNTLLTRVTNALDIRALIKNGICRYTSR